MTSMPREAHAQTQFYWRSDAPSGDWNAGTSWWTTTSTAAGFGQLNFDNNNNTTMTNNSSFDTWRIYFTATASAARTVGGTGTITFYDYGGNVPVIRNDSTATHQLDMPINIGNQTGADAATRRLEIVAASGDLSFGGTLSTADLATDYTRELRLDASSSRNITMSGAITEAANNALQVRKVGTGTATFSGSSANTYTLGTTVEAGTLILNKSAGVNAIGSGTLAISSGATVSASAASQFGSSFVTNNGTLNFNNNNQQMALAGAGTVSLGSATLTNTNTGDDTFSGLISGSGGSLIKAGSGTLRLTGTSSTYSGATKALEGLLAINGDGSLGTAPGAATADSIVISNASLGFNGSFALNANRGMTLAHTGATLNVFDGNTVTNNAIIASSGTAALTKSGGGTLFLGGNNSYSGLTTIGNGVIRATHSNAFGSTNDGVIVSSGMALQLSGGISIGAEAMTLNSTGLNNDGGLRNISGNNSWAGALTVTNGRINSDSGTLTVGGAIGMAGAANVTNALYVGGNGNVTLDGVITGASTVNNGALFKNGNGTLILSANNTNTLTGLFRLRQGTVSITNANSLNSGVLELNSGGGASSNGTMVVLLVNSNTTRTFETKIATDLTATGTNNATNTAINVAANVAFTQSGVLSQSGTTNSAKFGKAGAGTLILSATTGTYNGQIQIGEGTVILGHVNALGTNFSTAARGVDLGLNIGDVTTTNNVSLLASNNVTVGQSIYVATNNGSITRMIGLAGNGTNSFTNEIYLDGALTIDAGTLATDLVRVSSVIVTNKDGAGGGLIKTGSGTLVLSKSNSFTGGTTISAGTLAISNNGALGTGTVTLNSGVTIGAYGASRTLANNLVANGDFTIGFLATNNGAQTVFNGNLNLGNATRAITIGFNSASAATIGGVISNGGLNLLGSSVTPTLTLTGANTFSGPLNINGGTLAMSGSGTLNTAVALDISRTNANSSFDISGITANTFTIGSLAGASNAGATVVLGAKTLVAGGNNNSTTFGGVISGNGSFAKNGTGTLTLTRTNIYTGATTISNGEIALSGSGGLSTSTAVNLAGATSRFDISGISAAGSTNGSLAGAGGSVVNLGSKNLNVGGDNSSTTFAGVLTNTGSLTKSGTGTVTLSGANTYSGATTISDGQITLSGGGALSTNTAINLSGAASRMDLSGLTAAGSTNGSLAGAAGSVVNLGAKNLSVGGDNSSTTFAGILTNTGSLAKSGTGTMTLSGANSHLGGTTLSAGQLNINNAAALGSGTFTIGGGAIDNTSGAAITLANNNVQNWNADFTFVGTTNLNLGTGAVTMNANRQVTVTARELTVGGAIGGGAYSLTKAGAGTLTLSASNTFSGGTTLNAGTLGIGNSSSLGSGSLTVGGSSTLLAAANSLNITNNATLNSGLLTLDSQSYTLTNSGAISGTGALAKSGAGTLVLSGANTYSGSTTNNAGTLVVTGSGSLGTNTVAMKGSTAVLLFSNASSLITNTMRFGTNGATWAGQNGQIVVGTNAVVDANINFAASNNNSMTVVLTNGGKIMIGTGSVGGEFRLGNSSTTSATNIVRNDGGTFDMTQTNYSPVLGRAGGTGTYNAYIQTEGTFSGYVGNVGSSAWALGWLSGNALNLTNLTDIQGGAFNGSAYRVNFANNFSAGINVTNLVNTFKISGGTAGLGYFEFGGGTNSYTDALLTNIVNTVEINGGTLSTVRFTNSFTNTFNNYTNQIIFNGGTLKAATNSPSFIAASMNTNGVVRLDAGGGTIDSAGFTNTIAANLSGTGALTVTNSTGSGVLTLSGSNSYSGGTAINAGTLSLGNADALGASGTISFGGGTLQFTTNNTTDYSGRFSAAASQAYNIDTASGTAVTFATALTSSGGALTKSGTGTLTLSVANTYSGGTALNAGTLGVGDSSALGSGSLSVGGSSTLQAAANALNITNNAALNSGTLTLDSQSYTLTNSGTISGTGALTKAGAGTLTLSSANTYSGTTTISEGTLVLSGGANRLNTNSGVAMAAAGTTLDLGGNSQTLANLTTALTTAGTATIANGSLTLGISNVTFGNSTNGSTFDMAGLTSFKFDGASREFKVQSGTNAAASTNTFLLSAQSNMITASNVVFGNATGSGGTTNISQVRLGTNNTINVETFTIGSYNGQGSLDFQTNVSGGSLVLRGTNGSSAVTSWTIGAQNSGVRSGAGLVDLTGGTLDAQVTDALVGYHYALAVTAAENSYLKIGAGTLTANTLTLGRKSGTGTVTFNSSVTQSGGLVDAGTLTLGDGITNGASILKTIYNLNGGTLKVGTVTASAGSYSNTSSNSLVINGGNLQNRSGVDAALGGAANTASGRLYIVLSNNAANSLTVDAGQAMTISNTASLVDAGGFSKLGTGTLVLNSSNSYAGATTVSNGVLSIANANALGSTAAGTTIASGAALELSGGITTAAEALSISGTGVGSGGALRNVSGNNTYAGTVTLGAATLFNSDAGTLTVSGAIGGSGQDLTIGGAGNTLVSGAIDTGAGALTKNGAGTLTLTGTNSYSGGTTISSGTVRVGANSAYTNGAITGGAVGVGNLTLADGIKVTTSGTANIAVYATNIYLNGNITVNEAAAAGSAGTARLDFSGAWDLGGGDRTITVQRTNSSLASGNEAVRFLGTVTNTMQNGSLTLATTTGDTNSPAIVAFGGIAFVTNTALTVNDGVTVTTVFGSTSPFGTGSDAPALTLQADATRGGGVFQMGQGNNLRSAEVYSLSGGGLVTASYVTNNYSGTLTINNGNGATFSGVITDGTNLATLNLTKSGAGTQILSGSNSYTGATTVSGGTLALSGASGALSSSTTLAVSNGATFDVGGRNQEIAGLTGDGNVTNSSGVLTVDKTSSTGTFSGVLSGAGGLTKIGAGAVVLAGNNTYTGTTIITEGTVRLGVTSGNAIVSDILINGGTLDYFNSTNNQISDTATVTMSSGNFNVSARAETIAALVMSDGTLTKQGNALTMSGASTLTGGAVNLSNSATAQISFNSTLALGGATFNYIHTNASTAGVFFGDTVAYAATNTSGALFTNLSTATGRVNLNAGTREFNIANSGTLDAALPEAAIYWTVANGGILKTGDGVLLLGQTNSYASGTTLNGGTILVGTDTSLGTGAVTLSNGTFASADANARTITNALTIGGNVSLGQSSGGTGEITFSNANLGGAARTLTTVTNVNFVGAVTNGSLVKAGGATLALSNTGTSLANLDITDGTVAVQTNATVGGLAGSGSGALSLAGGTLTVSNSTNSSFGQVISGGGALTKSGNGTVTLSGTNTYTGTTTVSAGTLAVNGGIASTNTTVTSTGVLAGSGSIAGTTTILDGGTISPGNSPGTIYVTNMVWGTNGNYNWQLYDATGTAGATNGYDWISGSGSLTVSADATNKFNINLWTLSGLGPDTNGSAINFADTNSFQWTLGTWAGGISGFDTNYFNVNTNAINGTAGFANVFSGKFSLTSSNNSIFLNYAAAAGGVPMYAGTSGNWLGGFSPALYQGAVNAYFTGAGGNATNDIASGTVNTIGTLTFSNGAGSYTLTANSGSAGYDASSPLAIDGNIVNNSASAQTINLALGFSNASTINAAAGDMTFGGAISNGASLTFDGAFNNTVSGAMSGAGLLTKSGAGTLTLSGASTYSGGTLVSTGTLQGDTTGLQGTITNNATVVFSQTTNGTYGSAMSGSGALIKTGTGTLTLSGANSYTGATTVSNGVVQLGNAAGLGATNSGTTVVSGATLDFNGYNVTGEALSLAGTGVDGSGALINSSATAVTNTGAVTLTGNTTIGATGNMTQSGAVGGAYSLTKSGSGALTLSVSNAYSGGTVINSGAVYAGNNNAFGTGTITINGGGFGSTTGGVKTFANNLVAGGDFFIGGGGSGSTFNGTLDLGGATRAITFSNNVAHTFNGVISNGALTINAAGLSQDIILAASNTYTGGTIINGGDVNLTNAGALYSGGDLSITPGAGTNAQFHIGAISADSTTLGSLAATNSAGAKVILDTKTLIAGGNNNSTTFGGVIEGTGGFTKDGTGTMTFTRASTYTGATTISNGEIALSGSGKLSSSTALNLAGGTSRFDISAITGGSTNGSLAGAAGSVVNLGSKNLNVGGDNSSTTFAGVISNTGSLTKSGTGTMTVTGANTYSGTTLLSGGKLQVGAGGATGQLGSGNITNNASLVVNRTGDITLANNISGTGSLTKQAAGTLVLSGSNSFSGDSTLSAGVIRAAHANALGAGALVASAGTTFQVTNGITVTNNLSVYTVKFLDNGNTLSGTITNNNTVYDVASGTTNTLSGYVTGSGGVELIGGGVLAITGTTNDYTGNTTISNGTLRISTLANSNTVSSIGVNNNVTLAGTATSTNLNANTTAVMDYTGGNVTTDRAFVMTNDGGMITMSSSTTEMTLTGSASGSGKLILGEGTLILSNGTTANSFAPGSIQVDTGATLALGADNQIGNSTGLILNGGTFLTGGSSYRYSDTLGTLTLTASSTIDLGSWNGGGPPAALDILSFADSSAITWDSGAILTITNWQGVAYTSSQVSQILFGSGGLTSTQLGQIRFANQGDLIGGFVNGNELVPVPEPRVYAAAVALLAAVGWRERRRLVSLIRRRRR